MYYSEFKSIFQKEKPIIAMIHVHALPGTPKNSLNPEQIIKNAISEALIYRDCGINVLMIENMHDIPFLKSNIGHEISALMSLIGYEIKQKTNLHCGIQILAGANEAALGTAYAAGMDFIRAEGFVFGHMADEGYIESCAAQLLRYRKNIDAENILIFTDIKKKHSAHSITDDVDLNETAKAAEFFLSDGVIITGKSTGEEADVSEVKKLNKQINIPILIGSGITDKNISAFYNSANGFIVGSHFKKNGIWKNSVDPERVKNFLKVVEKLQK